MPARTPTYLDIAGIYNVLAFGAKADGQAVTDAAISTGTAILSSATGLFTAAHVGKPVTVSGAGAAGVPLSTTILSRQSATQVTLSVTASTTVSSAQAAWGTDNTSAAQAALTACGNAGGGIVWCPSGAYYFAGSLTFPDFVALCGSKLGFTLQQTVGQPSSPPYASGQGAQCRWFVTANPGTSTGGFVTLGRNSTIQGVTFYYPGQIATASTPVVYPWTVQAYAPPTDLGSNNTNGSNASVAFCDFVNSYQAINFLGNRCYAGYISGNPIYRGIVVDQSEDVCRLEHVHFWPGFVGTTSALQAWQLTNGIAFEFGRSDLQYGSNLFAIWYKAGFHFLTTTAGTCYGTFMNCSVDNAAIGIWNEGSAGQGVRFVNADMTTNVTVGGISAGVYQASGSGRLAISGFVFRAGNLNSIRADAGSGVFSANDCEFNGWGGTSYAVLMNGGTVAVRNSRFATTHSGHVNVVGGTLLIVQNCDTPAGLTITGTATAQFTDNNH